MRIYRILALGLAIFFYFNGCSQRKDFEPKQVSGSVTFNHFLTSELSWTSRNSAMLKNGEAITQSGKTLLKLKKESKIIQETQEYYILAKDCQHIEIINKTTQESTEFGVSTCLVAGNIKDNFLAFVLNDNSYGVIDITKKSIVFSDRGSSIIAVNSLIAKPVFLDTNVVFPTLDGQLVVVSLRDLKVQRVVIVNSEQFFSNVIFLEAEDSKILAATPKKIMTLVDGKTFSYEANVNDVKFYKGNYYVLTLEGKIIELDSTLRVLNEIELPFASLSAIVINQDNLFTMERQGYLIKVDLKDFSYDVYYLQNILGKVLGNGIVFYDDKRIYYDKYFLDFSKDWNK
ncbi:MULTISPECIES: hypothetical protein [unclassified Helicobacter]|uniref:hypothetical protein n=1 Tax=unclassified Helicobacter TaxID=2593540 RepID=UPI000CF120F9|nr:MULTISPECIES: hypothetical protein [unclassified Helicobacter]